ncbi:hypothetical protein K1T35_19065 [Pseudonocardia sp. DSM 110487]|uniref:hypothetical protein n=1 Tax=Pseudonocardia sp. DSM 110487 TaxID=2865833 RepID=UPI001C6A8066|nr:hypothetical protein [Pseudonocardia sp. DSM 110487]QYN39107.1 hypothetical protein K1T35_19065 [Pseudonocardia sp. DSM 110487]
MTTFVRRVWSCSPRRTQAKGLPDGVRGATGGGPTGMINVSARKRAKTTRELAELLIKPPFRGQCGDQGEMVAR